MNTNPALSGEELDSLRAFKKWHAEVGDQDCEYTWLQAWAQARAARQAPRVDAPADLAYLLEYIPVGAVRDEAKRKLAALAGVQAATSPAAPGVPPAFVWPEPPPSKGQSHVLFEDGYVEGWAKAIDAVRAALAQAAPAVAADERVKFDGWLRGRWPNAYRPIDEKTVAGFYVFSENNLLWEVWQARATVVAPTVPAEVATSIAQARADGERIGRAVIDIHLDQMRTNEHYREREFNEILKLDADAGLIRFKRISKSEQAAQPAGAGAPSDAKRIRDEVDWENGLTQLLESYKHATDHGICSRESVQERIIADILARHGAAPAQAEPVAEFVACGVSVGRARFRMLKPIAIGTKLYATAPAPAGVAQADLSETLEPDGYTFGNSFYEKGNPRLDDDVRRHGTPYWKKPVAGDAARDDARDAARYRWMRWTFIDDENTWPDDVADAQSGDALDTAIDAAIQASANNTGRNE